MGSSTENSAFGPSRNPWALDRIPGGSSGGSAVAVAAGLAPLALGSDTGGSIRQPAALCGVVGLKPTYGRVSRYGLLAFASSLDQIGPLARTVRDAALTLAVIAGPRPGRCDVGIRAGGRLHGRSDRRRSAACASACHRRLLESGVDADVLRAFRRALDTLASRGATLVDIELPHARHAIAVYYLIATAEASSNLARYDGVRYGYRATGTADGPGTSDQDLGTMYARTRGRGFGPEVKRRIMLGTYVLSAGYYDAYYLKAQQVRTLIRPRLRCRLRARGRGRDADEPDAPHSRLGERVADPLQMYLADVFTVSANLAGLPAISVPCGFTARSAAGRPAADGPAVRRSDAAAPRGRLRAADRLVAQQEPPESIALTRNGRPGRDEKLLEVRMCDLGCHDRGHRDRAADRRDRRRARRAGAGLPAALLALGRMVHARRRAGHRHPVLSGAPAAGEARARTDARGGRRRSRDRA